MKNKTILLLFTTLILSLPVSAVVSLPGIFGDHMVLQQDHSYWSVEMETPKAGGPFQLSINGYNTLLIEDILIGEVWLSQ
jgi:sialate O-acetylesterase